ncbi:alpha/beta fold family hydrolase [Microcystis aeruginosa NIES-3806]|uniref:alpha/beta fold hydrolase n=1 Tax=Microcystis aeruginosa TaxID=1126 RepID=UPI0013074E4D|nr:alpha/beta fold hydrolase [Microcystis aeruginosa]GCL53088.1 alpha/beta fold family hydrolase [Microcystis aeruginosa NIES-3806]
MIINPPLTMAILESFLEVGPLKWFYRQVNPAQQPDTTPVILLHGLPAHGYIWRELLTSLEEYNINAIAPDWIGSGLSAKPDARDFAYTPSAFCQALADFIQALQLPKISLIVQGFLASVGLQYALENPDKIERLIVLNTPLSSDVKLPWIMKQWGLPFLGDMATQDPLLVDRTLETGSGFVISDADLAIFRQPYLKTSAVGRALVATIRNLNLSKTMAEIETGLENFEKPILFVWGMADPWLSSVTVEKLATKSGVELIPLAEAKHYPQEHWSKEINPRIINFLGRKT